MSVAQRERNKRRRERRAARAKGFRDRAESESRLQARLRDRKVGPSFCGDIANLIAVCPRLEPTLSQPEIDSFGYWSYGYPFAFRQVLKVEPTVRSLSTWKPRKKSADALFRSLCAHLFSKYPTPPFLWDAFFLDPVDQGPLLQKLALHVAQGGSMKSFPKLHPDFTVSLTARMCHDFLRSPVDVSADFSVIKALRSAQVKHLGGTVQLRNALTDKDPWGWRLSDASTEAFWVTLVQWFARQPLLDTSMVKPMCDFITHCRAEDPNFSMKGRTVAAVVREMEAWHDELNRAEVDRHETRARRYPPSGYRGATFDFSKVRGGHHETEIWRVEEILTRRDLLEEGRRQRHCVASYAADIEAGLRSIWTLTKEDNDRNWAMLTIELDNRSGRIVQARGRFNRMPTDRESAIMNRWLAVYRQVPSLEGASGSDSSEVTDVPLHAEA